MSKRSFTKLFRSILDSTLWVLNEKHVKVVWIAMLAEADGDGFVANTIPGLARRAGVSIEECEESLRIFLSPDKYSRTPDHEGRRIKEVMGGWILLNYEKRWKELNAEEEKERKKEYMREKRAEEKRARESGDVAPSSPRSATNGEVANVASISLSSSGSDLSDPDPEQPPCLPDVPGLLKPSRRERGEVPAGMPATRYKFRKDWKPNQRHRDRGAELGLTDEEILERAEDCRLKLHKQGFDTEDDHFMRELTWARNDKETKNARGRAGPVNEQPGATRGRDTAFGSIRAGGRE